MKKHLHIISLFFILFSNIIPSSNVEAIEGASAYPSISADGRFISFSSDTTDLVDNDTNGFSDIFVFDRSTCVTSLVSVASDGTQADSFSHHSSISSDGRFVAFQSEATNLVPGDTLDGVAGRDIFVHDRQTGNTTRVSVASDGTQANHGSERPEISADGLVVVFHSIASNLVPDDTNSVQDVFVHERLTGQTTRVSIDSDGTQGDQHSWMPSISADGRYIAFHSRATNLVPNDTNGYTDVFVHDRETGETTRVSLTSDGTQGEYASSYPSISSDGRFVSFQSISNLDPKDTNPHMDIYVHDRLTKGTKLVSISSDGKLTNRMCYDSSISGDGRFVAFLSEATTLAPGASDFDSTDIFVHDILTGETTAISVSPDGVEGNGNSNFADLSFDGDVVAYWSSATNLVPNDTNGYADVFVHERSTGLTTKVPKISIDLADSGFRPNPHGYNFDNFSSTDPTNFTIDDMRQMLGDDPVCLMFGSVCQPRIIAQDYLNYFHEALRNGHCFGLSMTSLRFFSQKYELPSDFVSLAENTFDLYETKEVLDHITYYQFWQYMEPFDSMHKQVREKSPCQILQDLYYFLSSENLSPPVLTIYKQKLFGGLKAGHAIIPYRIEGVGDGIFHVYVYDNNYPDISSLYLVIDINDCSWSYNPIFLNSYSGDIKSNSLGYIPFSYLKLDPIAPWEYDINEAITIAVTTEEYFLVVNSSGERFGYIDGQLIEEIEGAYIVPSLGGLTENGPSFFKLPSDDYQLTVSGSDLRSTETTSFTVFSENKAVDFENIPLSSLESSTIALNRDMTGAGFTSEIISTTSNIELINETDLSSRKVSIGNIVAQSSGELSIDAFEMDDLLVVDGSIFGGGSYDLQFMNVTQTGEDIFFHSDITILASDSHYYDFGNWDVSSPLELQIDHGSDGEIDEIIFLTNLDYSMYLPLIIK